MSSAQSHQHRERGGQNGGGDPFSSESFDPIDFINAIFPSSSCESSGASLSAHDEFNDANIHDTNTDTGGGKSSSNRTNTNDAFALLEQKLRRASTQMDKDVRKSIRDRSIAGERVASDVALAENAAEQLHVKMVQLSLDCERAYERSRDISRDVGKLDACKKRLQKAITSLRRLSMFVSATSQLETMCHRRNYREAAHLLEAVGQLSQHFAEYGDVPKIQRLRAKYEEIASGLKTAVFEDFATLWQPTILMNDPNAFRTLSDACLVVDALEPRVREDVVGRLTSKELAEYAASFASERNNVESVDRRCNWIAKRVREKSTAWGVFPERWAVARLFAASLCKMTRAFVTEALDNKKEMMRAEYGNNNINTINGSVDDVNALSQQNSDDAQVLLMALRRTLEFEAELDETFGNGEKRSSSSSSTSSDATNAKGVSLQEGETSLDGETASAVRERAERERKQRDLKRKQSRSNDADGFRRLGGHEYHVQRRYFRRV